MEEEKGPNLRLIQSRLLQKKDTPLFFAELTKDKFNTIKVDEMMIRSEIE